MMVELNGALSNPFLKGKDLQIERLLGAKEEALSRFVASAVSVRSPRGYRQGAVLGAVIEVLADGEPRSLNAIQTAVERHIGGPVPVATVRNALSEHSGRVGMRFRRAGRGVYQRA